MTEIRIDGRGGQGNVVAAYMLARAAVHAGRFAQAFPTFGPERRGAPVASFVRISDRPVRRRCMVREPLYVIVQDQGLLHDGRALMGLRPGAGVLVNSSRKPEEFGLSASRMNIASIPANAMAAEILGEPIPNTALLAALLTLTGLLPLDALEAEISSRFAGDAQRRNLALMQAAAQRVPAGAWKERQDA